MGNRSSRFLSKRVNYKKKSLMSIEDIPNLVVDEALKKEVLIKKNIIMKEYCDELKTLHNEIPVYGHGTIAELNSVYIRVEGIASSVIATLQERHKHMEQSLGINSYDIDNSISNVRTAKSETAKQFHFNRVVEQLKDYIDTLSSLVGCD